MALIWLLNKWTTASDFLIYFAIAANKRTPLRVWIKKPVFSCIKVQFTALTEIVRSYETGNYETNVGDHYGYSSYHQNVYWSSVAKNSELQIVLKTDDYRITIDYLRTRPVDLIIMDIDLPGTDGFTFLKRIKQIQSTVKVLFYHRNQNAFMLAERYKLVLTVLSVNAMIRMIFSCRSDDPLRIHVFPAKRLTI